MTETIDSLPSDLAAAQTMILVGRAARFQNEARAPRAEADLTHAHATASSADALTARLRRTLSAAVPRTDAISVTLPEDVNRWALARFIHRNVIDYRVTTMSNFDG